MPLSHGSRLIRFSDSYAQDRVLAGAEAIARKLKREVPFVFGIWAISRESEPKFAAGVLPLLSKGQVVSPQLLEQVKAIAAKASGSES